MKQVLLNFFKKRLPWNILNFIILFTILPSILNVDLQTSLMVGSIVFIVVGLIEIIAMALWGRK
ncbi:MULTISPECIES: hypothetical protein [Paenibacillus]|uniref:Uncharacterized protein n=1 Tax=Paenibacillus tyrfis TaxID=1501230 RepID=A0A081P283_9BACL|nr:MULTISPECIES: hypothetical protein [Paenibacillus]KEQ24806.1 hypothetical protein ET33_06955 [Paenibacillus tyrfis]MBU7319965.1 hypothetical protein [Paenibacillus oleatilyticus]